MTPQEEQLLNSLVERVNQTQLQEKDPDAEALLNQSLGSNPDALYIMAQTVLVQNIALEQAKAQVGQLQQQLQQQQQQARQPSRTSTFLGSLLGHRDAPAQQQTYAQPEPPFQPVAQPQYYPPQQSQYYPPPAQPPYAPVSGPPSFLQGAMQTAAGVAAGALAFEGVEAVLHGIGGHGGYGWGGPMMGMGGGMMGGGLMGGGFERPMEETVVNNYYDQPGGERREHFDQNNYDQGREEHHFHESSDQGGAQLSDASYNTQSDDRDNDQGNVDNSNYDNLGTDDGGSGFDDGGGGFDSGGGDVL